MNRQPACAKQHTDGFKPGRLPRFLSSFLPSRRSFVASFVDKARAKDGGRRPLFALLTFLAAGMMEGTAHGQKATDATNDVAVLIDETMPWQHLHLEGPSYFRLLDATNTPAAFASQWQLGAEPPSINTASGILVKVGITFVEGNARPMPWRPEWTSPLPPADWARPAFDDSAWARLYWPQPEWVDNNAQENNSKVRAPNPYDTVVLLARQRFVIADPTQVKACRLSLDYWGGVVVYVNGKEAVRRHLLTLPGGQTNLFNNVAEAYPENEWQRPGGKDPGSAPLVRRLQEVEIPAALLRPGVNVLAVEAHAAPVHGKKPWPPIGLLSARLSVSPAGAGGMRPRGIQVRNAATTEDLSICDPADRLPLRPIVVRAARNTIFSGRLVVGADETIKGLKVTAGDLTWHSQSSSSSAKRSSFSKGRIEDEDDDDDENDRKNTPGQKRGVSVGPTQAAGAKILAAAVRVRCAVPAPGGKSWRGGFDGLMDAIPKEIPLVTNAPPQRGRAFYCVPAGPETKLPPRAVAPIWLTVRVPKDAAAGVYEGRVTLSADGWVGTNLPLRVHVSAWTAPDPKDWRMQNFLYHAEEAVARHYGVTNYSPRHLELVGKSLALLAEINSRQVQANLVIGFAATDYMGGSGQGNPESLVRWVKQADGTFKHDFTNFDRYLEMVAQAIGKPRTLRLNCWGATQWVDRNLDTAGRKQVTVYDPATGQLSTLKQPPLGTPENYAFWKPVFDGVLERLKARGWLDETTLGYNPWNGGAPPTVVDVAYKLWPEGEWSWTGHNPQEGAMPGSQTGVVMKVRNANTVYSTADPGRTPAWLLDGPRRSTIIWTARMLQSDYSPLREIRRLEELYGLMAGYDGLGEFGADLFPVKTPAGGYSTPAAGAGTGWVSPGRSTLALLYPGPDGPVATERFEMFREGVELCEAVLFIRQAMAGEKLIGTIKNKIEDYLHLPAETVVGGWYGAQRVAIDGTEPGTRLTAVNRGAFVARHMQSAEDAKLLDLADEVLEYWRILGAAKTYGLKATGGTFTNLTDGFWVHRFTKAGTAQITPTEDITVEYLVVGGGGGGATGSRTAYGTGGGGAGGLVTSVSGCYSGGGTPGIGSPPGQPVKLKAGTTYSVTVGDGGAAGANGQDSAFGNPGADFARAKGGGGGGGSHAAGQPGGSGGGGGGSGGAAGAGTTNQGFAGGAGGGGNSDNGGGGGGAGGVGVASTSTVSRAKGGPGLMNTITCNSVIYAGGGGGGGNDGKGTGGSGGGGNARGSGGDSVDGMNGRGGGGGGGQSGAGGQGGSGIVIIRYKAGAKSSP